MCLGAIVWANIKKVYYGSDLQDATAIGFRDELFYDLIKNNNLKEIIDLQELNHQECVELLQEYKDNNKEMY
jgi:guanine deaminase